MTSFLQVQSLDNTALESCATAGAGTIPYSRRKTTYFTCVFNGRSTARLYLYMFYIMYTTNACTLTKYEFMWCASALGETDCRGAHIYNTFWVFIEQEQNCLNDNVCIAGIRQALNYFIAIRIVFKLVFEFITVFD